MLVVSKYRNTRFWGLYDSGELLCVTVYKKGANAVKVRLEELSREPQLAAATELNWVTPETVLPRGNAPATQRKPE